MRPFSGFLASVLLSLVSVPTQAQVHDLGPTPIIAGKRVVCGGSRFVVVPGLNDVARATAGIISINPVLFQWPGPAQLFVLGHECAHQIPAIGGNERAADCWSVQTGRRQGWLVKSDLPIISQYFASSSGDWTHEPGPIRVQRFPACFDAVYGAADPESAGTMADDEFEGVDPLEDQDESGDVMVNDADINWSTSASSPYVSFWYELENDGDKPARCELRVNSIVVDRTTRDPIRVNFSHVFTATIPSGTSRRVRGRLRWANSSADHMPAVREQLVCEE